MSFSSAFGGVSLPATDAASAAAAPALLSQRSVFASSTNAQPTTSVFGSIGGSASNNNSSTTPATATATPFAKVLSQTTSSAFSATSTAPPSAFSSSTAAPSSSSAFGGGGGAPSAFLATAAAALPLSDSAARTQSFGAANSVFAAATPTLAAPPLAPFPFKQQQQQQQQPPPHHHSTASTASSLMAVPPTLSERDSSRAAFDPTFPSSAATSSFSTARGGGGGRGGNFAGRGGRGGGGRGGAPPSPQPSSDQGHFTTEGSGLLAAPSSSSSSSILALPGNEATAAAGRPSFPRSSHHQPPAAPASAQSGLSSSSSTAHSSSLTPIVNSPQKAFVSLFQVFLNSLFSQQKSVATRELETRATLEAAFFDMNSNVSGPEILPSLQQMIGTARSQSQVEGVARFTALDRWAAVYYLGCNLNYLDRAITEGTLPPNVSWRSAFQVLLERANIFGETFMDLYREGKKVGLVPYSAIRVVLRRCRTLYEKAQLVGFNLVASQLGRQLSTLVRLEGNLLKPLTEAAPVGTEARIIACTAAEVLCELIVNRSMNDLTKATEFASAFHFFCEDDTETRCTLYFRIGQLYLQRGLGMSMIQHAHECFLRAYAMCPSYAPSNQTLMSIHVLAAGLALGYLPAVAASERTAIVVPDEFSGVVEGLRTASVALFDASLEEHRPYFVDVGVAALVEASRAHVLARSIAAYHKSLGGPSHVDLRAFLTSVQGDGTTASTTPTGTEGEEEEGLQRRVAQAKREWLLPLLMERHINGALDGHSLLLSRQMPFRFIDSQ